MEDYIEISTLNDFVFCPYSIYLHNVYKNASEDIYYAKPQLLGRYSHKTVDDGTAAAKKGGISGLAVFSEKYGLMGKIDIYFALEAKLVERKRNIAIVHQGQIYQLWAQMLCMMEMGYDVKSLGFYETSTHKMIPVKKPNDDELQDFIVFLERYRNYNPGIELPKINKSKCRHCIYCNLCDKTEQDNVYTQGY